MRCKNTRHSLQGLVSSVIALAVLAVSSNAQEPGVPVVEGDVVPLCYGDHTSGATIGFTGDLDIYFFLGKAGDTVRINMRGQSIGLDPRIDVRDPVNASLTTASCSGADGQFGSVCGFVETFTLPVTGAYSVLVDEVGNTQTGSYLMNLERVLPTTPEPYLAPSVATNVGIGHAGDHDYLRFMAEAGSEVQFVISGQTVGLDPRFEIFEENGSLLYSDSCLGADGQFGSTCTFQFSAGGPAGVFSFPGVVGSFGVPGEVRRYVARLSDVGFDQTGTIRVTMNEVFSPSAMFPLTQPAFGPVGASYCTSTINSTTARGLIVGVGSDSVADDDFHLMASSVPASKSAIFLYSQGQTTIPIGQGTLCVQPPIGRFPLQTICGLEDAHLGLDMPNLTQGFTITAGSTWNFQMWFRDDDGMGGSTTNTTDGLSVSFVP